MTVIGIDDTDSRERGMCTTYVAARLAERIRELATVYRLLLVRLNPAVEHKTRGNAALAIHTTLGVDEALGIAERAVEGSAVLDDGATQPGLVVAPGPPGAVPPAVAGFARDAQARTLDLEAATSLIESAGYRSRGWGIGRGRIGALAAVGAWRALDDWTVELIAYREPARWGTPREIDAGSVFAAAEAAYPAAWDTVDRVENEPVCVPHTPGPVLYGVRGDRPEAVRAVADGIEAEPVAAAELFVTNQGTDGHLRPGRIGALVDGRAYRVTGTVGTEPATRRGGHVFFELVDADGAAVTCAAFEPTKRFRDRVRALRSGDRITACGEVADGTLKLEKFAVRELRSTEAATPTCPGCGRRMESAGAGQGYRCRRCETSADGKTERRLERHLEPGWYEVPPCARRHIARPLVRGGFDAPVHPER